MPLVTTATATHPISHAQVTAPLHATVELCPEGQPPTTCHGFTAPTVHAWALVLSESDRIIAFHTKATMADGSKPSLPLIQQAINAD